MTRRSSRPYRPAQPPQLARRLSPTPRTKTRLAYIAMWERLFPVHAVPGGRYGAATWTDAAGNLWMFGGNGNSDSSRGFLNDLWEFNASSYNPNSYNNLTGAPYTSTPGVWTWKGGSSSTNQAGTYTGARWSPALGVNAVTWKDGSGNFWLFGGYGFDGSSNEGFLSDLWEYTGGNWVFVSGNQDGQREWDLWHAGNRRIDQFARWTAGSRWLGRCQWKSLALWWRRTRFHRHAKRDP